MIVSLEKLAVQVGRLEVSGVGEHEPADARGGKFISHHAAEAADAGDEHRRALELALALLAKARHPHLPFVNGALLLCQGWQVHGAPNVSRSVCRTRPLLIVNNRPATCRASERSCVT